MKVVRARRNEPSYKILCLLTSDYDLQISHPMKLQFSILLAIVLSLTNCQTLVAPVTLPALPAAKTKPLRVVQHRTVTPGSVQAPSASPNQPLVNMPDATRLAPTPLASRSSATSTSDVVSGRGRKFRIIHTTEQDDFKEYEWVEKGFRIFNNRPVTGSEGFAGHDRGAAKTSMAKASPEKATGLVALLNSLSDDNSMRHYHPPISKDWESPRVQEENRNVTVNAFLYAAKREPDGDFHVIIGSSATGDHARFMNVEISGLPAGGPSYNALAQARSDFKTYFAGQLPGSGYDLYEEPIPVKVSGSLFYDIDHAPGLVGPAGMKPTTAWEIHPITAVVFEP